jgi:RHS repeat-associated protein
MQLDVFDKACSFANFSGPLFRFCKPCAATRTKNAARTSFLYDGANAAQELSGSTVTANLLSGSVDEVFTRADGSGAFTPLKDALGSTIALVNSSGSIATAYSYDPFGNTTTAGAVSANPSQHTGRENEGNGLYYLRARYYSPLLGRFVSEDPLGFQGGDANLYAFVGDDPIDFKYPSLLCRVQVAHHTPYEALPNQILWVPPIPWPGPVPVDLPQHSYVVLGDIPLNGRYTKAVFSAFAEGKWWLPFGRVKLYAPQVGIGADARKALGDYTKDPLDTATEDDGRSCDEDIRRLNDLADRINAAQIDYHTATGPNSNSATNAALKALGINWAPGYPAPGWSTPLGVK